MAKFGPLWGGSLTHLMLITVFLEFWLGTLCWGWIPKFGGVWTEYHLILIPMLVLTRLLSPVLTELNCNFFWSSLPVQSFHNSHLANLKLILGCWQSRGLTLMIFVTQLLCLHRKDQREPHDWQECIMQSINIFPSLTSLFIKCNCNC